ncbi:DUF2119 family protein [Candidatus Bathyarchaeota archaeon]|nr:DUF2119 family protein [Candidatus Bathyarchaeota archaeon]MBS7617964.1 DUF2119 family protein [Candidatus Bathyarchaeota archaeon]
MKMYKSIGSPIRPLRLFVGGVHGKEYRTTKLLFEKLVKTSKPKSGSAIVIPCLYMGRYVSTLSSNYLNTKACKRLVKIVKAFKPDIYVEVHCYRLSSYSSLTSLNRINVKGVPPLIEIENGVLIGSISPLLKAKLNLNIPILIETPCGKRKNFKVALKILRVFLMANSTQEALEALGFKHEVKNI